MLQDEGGDCVSDIIRFPIGQFTPILNPSDEKRNRIIHEIPEISSQLRSILIGLKSEHYQVPYRPGGWTIQQIVHHMTDNDMNAYIRFKRALTEEEPQAS